VQLDATVSVYSPGVLNETVVPHTFVTVPVSLVSLAVPVSITLPVSTVVPVSISVPVSTDVSTRVSVGGNPESLTTESG
jgi:hypothetical protein